MKQSIILKLNRDQSDLNCHFPPSLMICGRISYINVVFIDWKSKNWAILWDSDFNSWGYFQSQHLSCVDSHREWLLGWLFISRDTFTFFRLWSSSEREVDEALGFIRLVLNWCCFCVMRQSHPEHWMSLAVMLLSSPVMAACAVYFHVLRFLCIFCNTGMCWI